MEVFQNTLNWNRHQLWDFYCILFSLLNSPDYFRRHIVLFITIFKMFGTFYDFWNAKDGNNLLFLCCFRTRNFEKRLPPKTFA